MHHQDWVPVVLNNTNENKNKKANGKKDNEKSKYLPSPEIIKLVPTENLGVAIAKARNTKKKTQAILANEIGVSPTVLGRWENNKETPTNAQVSLIERKLGIKLPRSKIVKQLDE